MTDWNEVFDRRPVQQTDTTPMAKLEDLARMGDCTPPAVKGCKGPISIHHRSGYRSVWERATDPWWKRVEYERLGG